MTLSRNPELWQSLPAEKQHELENSPDFIAIEQELERLSSEHKDDPCGKRPPPQGAAHAEKKAGVCRAPQMPEASTKETTL